MVGVADGAVQVVKSLGRWDQPAPYLSPDGRYIAYDVEPQVGVKDDIFLLAADRSHEIPLVQHPADDEVLGWSPDGTRLLFSSDRMGTIDVWMIEIADGKPQGSPQLVRQNIGGGLRRGLSSDGALYYEVRTRELWVMENFLSVVERER